ncbi:ferritin family protein [Candidatus Bipolaricaulota bacterium]|nr:ferritin family protein [Candidatus Bipolaricaulota bacterium]
MERDGLLDVLRRAMEVERDGYQFYALAAERSADAGAKDTFARLAAEEKAHYGALQRHQHALMETGAWDVSVLLDDAHTLDPSPEIFSEGFRRRLRGKHLEMSALSIGILLEKNAVEFYLQAAAEATDDAVRSFFRELANWEDGHYQMLLRHDEALKEDYWNENRFSPLL